MRHYQRPCSLALLVVALSAFGCEAWWVNEDGWVDPDGGALEWQNPANDDAVTFEGAAVYCADLVWADLDDWRVPTHNELKTLSTELDNGEGCYWKAGLWGPCYNTFWSSQSAPAPDDTTQGLVWNFGSTLTSNEDDIATGNAKSFKSNSNPVRCVR